MFPVTAVGAAVSASVTDGATSVLEQRSTKQVPAHRNALSVRLILDLLHRPMWLIAIGLDVLAWFLAVARPHGGRATVALAAAIPLGVGLAAVLAACLALARAGPGTMRPIMLALACGIAYGVTAFLLNQSAFQAGTSIAPVLSVITAADPLVSIGIAHQWLHESIAGGPVNVTMEVVALVVMIAGIIVLAHRAPQAVQQPADPVHMR